MTDRPIIFSAPMVKALLDGHKSQTRRIAKIKWRDAANQDFTGWRPEQVGATHWQLIGGMGVGANIAAPCAKGDRLWVRETHSTHNAHGTDRQDGKRWGPWGGLPTAVSPDGERIAYYREGFDRCGFSSWRPSIHMPRWASRLTLVVTDVRVQRLREISAEDVAAEGACELAFIPATEEDTAEARAVFRDIWNSLHGPDAWDANPWVAALRFETHRCNIDQMRGQADE